MKRYFNGKYIEMTEEERSKSRERFAKIAGNRRNRVNPDYEARIAALEAQIAELTAKLSETKTDELTEG